MFLPLFIKALVTIYNTRLDRAIRGVIAATESLLLESKLVQITLSKSCSVSLATLWHYLSINFIKLIFCSLLYLISVCTCTSLKLLFRIVTCVILVNVELAENCPWLKIASPTILDTVSSIYGSAKLIGLPWYTTEFLHIFQETRKFVKRY